MTAEHAEESLLTELCAICHSNPPKYKCPRCSIKTCSLHCIKRHKLLSECSGVRDPAAYRKRNELATAASFDQDFNFITDVERSIERADREASNRGVSLVANQQRPIRGEHRLRLEQEKSGVTVMNAPTGMSRNKQNKSHWNQRHKHISWTVEWILQDGQKISANCLESISVIQAFNNAVPKKSQQPLKRKLDELLTTEKEQMESRSNQGCMTTERSDDPSNLAKHTSANLHFYLHRPDIPSRRRCIQHVASNTIISDALRGRVVLEFPTFYVIEEAPDQIPETYELVDASHALSVSLSVSETANVAEKPLTPETDSESALQLAGQHSHDEQQVLEALSQDLVT